jgi:hypothetical protein
VFQIVFRTSTEFSRFFLTSQLFSPRFNSISGLFDFGKVDVDWGLPIGLSVPVCRTVIGRPGRRHPAASLLVVLSHGKPLRRCVYSRAGRSSPLTILSSRTGRRILATPSSYREAGLKRHRSRPSMVYPTRAVIIKLFRPLVAGHLHPPGREAAKAPPPPSSQVAEANSPTHQSRNIVRAMADAGALSSCSH